MKPQTGLGVWRNGPGALVHPLPPLPHAFSGVETAPDPYWGPHSNFERTTTASEIISAAMEQTHGHCHL